MGQKRPLKSLCTTVTKASSTVTHLSAPLQGTSRGGADLKEIVRRIDLWGLTHLYVVGGNGGNAAANAINQELQNADVICSVIGVPKSIDNDILLVRFCQTSLHLNMHSVFSCSSCIFPASFLLSFPFFASYRWQSGCIQSVDVSSTKMCSPDYMLSLPLLPGNSQPRCYGPLLVTNGLKLQHGMCLLGDLSDLNVCFVVTAASSSRRALSPLKLIGNRK